VNSFAESKVTLGVAPKVEALRVRELPLMVDELGYSRSPSPEMLEAHSRSTADLMVNGLFQ